MFKRALLATTFVAALGAAGLGMSGTAEAWDSCGVPYRATYAPAVYPTYYGYAPSVPVYRPSVVAYRAPVVVRDFHDGHHHHHDHDHNFLSFSFGF